VHPIGLTARGTLDVQDRHNFIRDVVERHVPTSLEQHFVPALDEPSHQVVHLGLQERLAARNLDQTTRLAFDLEDDVGHGHPPAAGKGIRRIAPAAAQVAGRQADEDARPADMRRFSLNGCVDFADREHCSVF
jgi:hypothetical protein